MKQTPDLSSSRLGFKSRLPVKITGIVFWGSLLVGLWLTIVQMKNLSDEINDRQLEYGRMAVRDLQRLADDNWDDPAFYSGHIVQIEGILNDYGFIGLDILSPQGNAVFQWGSTRDATHRIELPLHSVSAGVAPEQTAWQAGLYYASREAELREQRRDLLIYMGIMFSAFGFILQWILQRVLTRPFIGMVNTAQRFAGGDMTARFDDQREDEFGYLGKFFNKALDYLLLQQEELREALARVRESETALYSEKEKAEVTLHSIGDAVITSDKSGCVDYLNPVAERLIGFELSQVMGEPIEDVMRLIDEVTREAVPNPVTLCLREGEVIELAGHTLLVRQDGVEVAIADSAAPITDHSGLVIGAVMVFHDVGHARNLQRQLSYQAKHDALTGLFNRREFELRLNELIAEARNQQTEHVMCYLDLDQFKVVNDTCGHIAGDELLRQLAQLLQSKVRDSDVLARLGGDEFGVLLQHCSLDQARSIAEDLRRAVRDYRFIFGEHSFEIGVSIGVVDITTETQSMTEIYGAADVACYSAKDAGRNRIHVFKPDDLDVKARQGEMRWVSRIQKALDEDRFVLYCQPIIGVGRRSEPTHYEILLRIQGEDGELIPPMAFIPAAERYNLMSMIDRWVVGHVLQMVQNAAGPLGKAVWTINISGVSLGNDELLDYLVREIESSPLVGEQLCFEITETAAIANLRQATRFMQRLRKFGCRFALDDFGSGLSSFAYLKNLEVDYLKIDGSFVRDMASDPIDHAMVEAINRVGQVMNLKTIAEFVETAEILHSLEELGVNFAQGYFIAKPEPLADCLERYTPPPQILPQG